jgi:hypothetical protein
LSNIKNADGVEVIPSRIKKIEGMILKALSQLFESMDNTEIYDCISSTTNILEDEQEEEEQETEPDIKVNISDEDTLMIEAIKERRLRQFCESLEAYIETLRRKRNIERLAEGFEREVEKREKAGEPTKLEEEVAESGWQVVEKLEKKLKIIGEEEVLRWIKDFIKNKKLGEITYILSEPEEKEMDDPEQDDNMYPDDDEYGDDEYGDE